MTTTVLSTETSRGQPFDGGRFYLTELFFLSDGSIRGPEITLCDADADWRAISVAHTADMSQILIDEALNG